VLALQSLSVVTSALENKNAQSVMIALLKKLAMLPLQPT
jgi:hypothetical protein